MSYARTATTVEPVLRACLDHVVVVLDSEAYGELLRSDLVGNRLGRFKVKQADSSLASSYTAAGLAGETTLIEFFDTAAPPLPGLRGGLVLSFEVPGSMERAHPLVRGRLGGDVRYELVQRSVEGMEERQPWYSMLQPDLGPDSPFLFMLAEVRPEYFEHIGARPGPAGELSRRAYLDASLGGAAEPAHLLKDVAGVTVNLRPERAESVRGVLEAVAWSSERREGGWRLWDSGVTVDLRDDPDRPEGVVAVDLELRRPAPDGAAARFGATSRLVLDGARGAWTFLPPPVARAEEP